MKELSLHLLDIVKNSTAAGASLVEVRLEEDESRTLTVTIKDDGRGMSPELVHAVFDPFTTTRTTRKVGMGIPLYRLTAEQTGGGLTVESEVGAGTTVTAVFHRDHLDCPPLGDFPGVAAMLIQGSPDADFLFVRSTPKGSYELDTREMREMLGENAPLNSPEVFLWVNEYLKEQEATI